MDILIQSLLKKGRKDLVKKIQAVAGKYYPPLHKNAK